MAITAHALNREPNIDGVMSEVGSRALGALHKGFKGIAPETSGHIVANALADAGAKDRYEVADLLIDLIGVSQLLEAALAEGKLDHEEEEVFRSCIKDLAGDALGVIKSILPEKQ